MKRLLLLSCCLLAPLLLTAHVVPYDPDPSPPGDVFWKYLVSGFGHILPAGPDHILFIGCVFFLNTDLRKIILQATMFTVAHSVTLALAVYGVIRPPLHIVEPLIAASILFLALENLYSARVQPWRLVMVFLFGLVHGMGFAGALSAVGLPESAFATALVAFNAGVELGQLCIILTLYLLVARPFGARWWYRQRIVVPSSLAIAGVAAWWTVQRIFFEG